MPTRVAVYGVGMIGRLFVREAQRRLDVEVVAAVDVDPSKVGEDVGVLSGVGRMGVVVSDDPDEALSKAMPDVVVHATSSYLRDVYGQLMGVVGHGVDVISTCEELTYPYLNEELSKMAERLDEEAKAHGSTVLGVGINPGFMMDLLPSILTTPCISVGKVFAERVIDASKRRRTFREKVGVGMTEQEFREAMERKRITGHVGLTQSMALIAKALGSRIDGVEESFEPVLAERDVEAYGVRVQRGRVLGIRQEARGLVGDEERVVLRFQAYVGAPEVDRVEIDGVPPVKMTIRPCVHGDLGTVGVLMNYIPRVLEAPPGLKTVLDLLPAFSKFVS